MNLDKQKKSDAAKAKLIKLCPDMTEDIISGYIYESIVI